MGLLLFFVGTKNKEQFSNLNFINFWISKFRDFQKPKNVSIPTEVRDSSDAVFSEGVHILPFSGRTFLR